MIRRIVGGTSALFLAIVFALAAAAPASASPSPVFNPPKSYYLSLGDSIAYGFQTAKALAGLPPTAFDTGYADDFGRSLRGIRPGITTVNYGCPGETTASFISGPCIWKAAGFALHDDYSGSQLDAAVAFLHAHPGQVSPITLTLWSNDVNALIRSCGFDLACIQNGAPATMSSISSNLATILSRLRSAAPDAEILVTGAIDTLLGLFDVADPLFLALNAAMRDVADSARARFANLFPIFNPQGDPAAETAAICTLTLLCTDGDSHPSDTGYEAIANVIFDASGYTRLVG
jgi:lysophospholipase L1-like esterase